MGKSRPVLERFWEKVARGADDDCWLWTGNRTGLDRYGRFYPQGNRGVLAHVFAYQLTIGPVPDGLELDHLCRNPPCVNPRHLEPVTHAENVRRFHAVRTTCKYGHPLVQTRTTRLCEICTKETKRRSAERRREAYRERRRALERQRYQAKTKDNPEYRAVLAAKALAGYYRRRGRSTPCE